MRFFAGAIVCALCEHAHERNPLRFVHEIAGEVNNISHELRFMHALDFPIPQWIKAESPHAAIWPSTPRPRPSPPLCRSPTCSRREGRREGGRSGRGIGGVGLSPLGLLPLLPSLDSPRPIVYSHAPLLAAFALQSFATPPSPFA